ncbi:MAG: hypothetical protein Q9159_003506 [Coniocarpon cinnabarinum]
MSDSTPSQPPVVPITPISAAVDNASRSQPSGPLNSVLSPLAHNPVTRTLRDVYNGFQERRSALGLSNPGVVEDISREVSRDVLLRNQMFAGFRAEFSKIFSTSPMFQTAHSLAMGNNGAMPPYSFAALYGSPKIFMQGNVNNEFSLSSQFNYRPFSALTLRNSVSLSPSTASQAQSNTVQVEATYKGQDFSVDLKAINPSVIDSPDSDLTGILVGSYLQSITPRLALGLETMWQRQTGDEPPQTITSYAMRYRAPTWIASAQLMPTQGVLQSSYWQKVAKQVDVGLDLNLSLMGTLSGAAGGAALGPMMGQLKNEGTATAGIKYEFRTSQFRGQVDSNGKVSALLERRVAPMIMMTFAGEMDHAKSASKIGLAVQIESAGSEEFMDQQEKAQQIAAQGGPPPIGDIPPY